MGLVPVGSCSRSDLSLEGIEVQVRLLKRVLHVVCGCDRLTSYLPALLSKFGEQVLQRWLLLAGCFDCLPLGELVGIDAINNAVAQLMGNTCTQEVESENLCCQAIERFTSLPDSGTAAILGA